MYAASLLSVFYFGTERNRFLPVYYLEYDFLEISFFKIGPKLKYNLEEIKEGRMDELGWPPLFSFSTECILFWFQVFICGAHIPPWASGWPPEFQLFVFARIIQEQRIKHFISDVGDLSF